MSGEISAVAQLRQRNLKRPWISTLSQCHKWGNKAKIHELSRAVTNGEDLQETWSGLAILDASAI